MKSSLDPIVPHGDTSLRTGFAAFTATSERAPFKSAGPAKVVAAVATGSLPGFVGELLRILRANEAHAKQSRERFDADTSNPNWTAYQAEQAAWSNAVMLVEILAATRGVQIQRQPEENNVLGPTQLVNARK